MKKTLSTGVGLVLFAANIYAHDYREGFEDPQGVGSWRPVAGAWTVADGKYVHTRERTSGERAYAVSLFGIGDGTIEVTATATQRNKINKGGCFGLMKYADKDNWYVVRYGSYGHVTVKIIESGKSRVIQSGYHFKPKIGQSYRVKVMLKGDKTLIFIENKPVGIVEGLPVFDGESYTGLFALSACTFDDFCVSKGFAKAGGGRSGIARVWAVDDGERIRRDDRNHPLAKSPENKVWNGSAVEVFGARNEIIAFQLIIQSGDSGVNGVDVRLDSLSNGAYTIRNTGGAGDPYDYRGKRIELFTEHYAKIVTQAAGPSRWWSGARPKDIYGKEYTGWLPDALIPFEAPSGKGGAPFDIPPNSNQGVWVDIYIPKDAPPGMYRGRLQVLVGGVVSRTIPVAMRVYGFVLPDESHFKNFFLGSPRPGNQGLLTKHPGQLGTSAFYELEGRYFQMAHRHRMDLTFNPSLAQMKSHCKRYITGEFYAPEFKYEGPGVGTPHGTFSIGTYDQNTRGRSGRESGFRDSREAWREASYAWVKWFKENSPSTEIFKYMLDEPHRDKYDEYIKKRADWIPRDASGRRILKTFATVLMDPQLYGYVDFWSVTGQAGYQSYKGVGAGYDVKKARERHAAGDKVGVYNDQRPGHGAPLAIADGVEARVTAWIAWKYDIDQYFMWQTTYWNYGGKGNKNNIFQTYAHKKDGRAPGNGFFFYPGEEKDFPEEDRGLRGPISCMRMKNWRRGMQDYEYLWLARRTGEDTTSIVNDLVPRAFNDYGPVEGQADFTSQNQPGPWATRGYAFERARRQLAEMLAGNRKLGPPESKKASAQVMARWDARLIARVTEGLAAGRSLRFYLRSTRQEVTSIDGDGTLALKSRGIEMRMKWSRLSIRDRKNLAVSCAVEGDPSSHAVAAFYLLAAGDRREAEKHLGGAGDEAGAVRSAFEQQIPRAAR